MNSRPRPLLSAEPPDARTGDGPPRVALRIDTLCDIVADGAIALDARGVIVYANRVAQALVGAHLEALRDRRFLELPNVTADGRFARAVREVLAEGGERTLSIRDAESPPFHVDVCRIVALAGGGALVLLGEIAPPSAMTSRAADSAADEAAAMREALEAARAFASNPDIRRLAEQMRQREKLAALGELLAGVAHELNNPLAGISAFAQLLLEEPLADGQRESVRLIKRESDRATGVLRDLLLFARSSGPTRAPVDLNAVLELTLRLRAYSLRSADVTVVSLLEPGLPAVVGDEQRLQQVVLNLLVNAEHALSGASTRQLTVHTARRGDRVILEVTDTGAGMAADVQQRIFEPFFTTKPPGAGTGLGLSVSRAIVDAYEGSISVTSAPGRGATFRVSLPIAPDAFAEFPDSHSAPES
jgi:signal transduction histidine kinase